MKLYAISDLHLSRSANRQALEALPAYPEDWLIIAGDVGESHETLRFALDILTRRFRQVLWTPGNHDLWTLPSDPSRLSGEIKYLCLVSICREYGVLTPEDPYVPWPGDGPACLLAPIFVLYDHSFRPDDVPPDKAVEWAADSGIVCADEILLNPTPYPSRPAWCAARCAYTENRLQEAVSDKPIVLISHFPLREDLLQIESIPRFSIWCGTRRTEEWLTRFPVEVGVYGHLHVKGTHVRDGVRFEEVSLSYANSWQPGNHVQQSLREILPGDRR